MRPARRFALAWPLVLSGCLLGVPEVTPPARPQLHAQISTLPGGGDVSGVSYVFTSADRSRIVIRLVGGAMGTALGWRVRTGRCSDATGVTFGTPSAYPTLVAWEGGGDLSSAAFDLPINPSGLYRVEILSREDSPRVLACGNLVRPDPGG